MSGPHRRHGRPWQPVLARLRVRFAILRLFRLGGSRAVTLLVLATAASVVLPLAFIVASGELVRSIPDATRDGFDSPAGHRLTAALGATSLLFAAENIVGSMQIAVLTAIRRRIDSALRSRLVRVAARGSGIGHLEGEGMQERFAQASNTTNPTSYTPGAAASGLAAIATPYLQALGALVLLATYSWPLAILVFGAALLIRSRYQSKDVFLTQLWTEGISGRQRARYLLTLVLGGEGAKEIRLFRVTDWIRRRYAEEMAVVFAPVWRARLRGAATTFPVLFVAGVGAAAAALATIGDAAVAGEIDVGRLVVLVQATLATLAVARYTASVDLPVQYGTYALPALEELDRLTEPLARAGGGRPAGDHPHSEIRFESVSFAYPASSRLILDGVDLCIPIGKSLALVGANGAGKTTLVKLLARLYEPTSGRITVDGVDLSEFDASAWQRRLTAVFQDFVRYDLPVRDNVGFGAIERAAGDAALAEVAERAELAELVARLPRGWDTILSPAYADGVDLSGGEWQRVALARALHGLGAGARILVLDEPTASLDVAAEAAFFDRLLRLEEGVTTIVISHRFATIRRADRICVIEGGSVAEEGSHAELLASDGTYARMFRLQAGGHAGAE